MLRRSKYYDVVVSYVYTITSEMRWVWRSFTKEVVKQFNRSIDGLSEKLWKVQASFTAGILSLEIRNRFCEPARTRMTVYFKTIEIPNPAKLVPSNESVKKLYKLKMKTYPRNSSSLFKYHTYFKIYLSPSLIHNKVRI